MQEISRYQCKVALMQQILKQNRNPPPKKNPKTKQNENQIKTNWSKCDFDTPSKQHWKAQFF